MASNKSKNPSRSIMKLNTSFPIDSHQFHSDHAYLPPSYVVNIPAQDSTQCASTHFESTFSSPKPRILTLPQIDTILKQNQERVDRVLTIEWSRQTGQPPIYFYLPQVQDNHYNKDPFFIKHFTYQENPTVGTPEYHLPKDTSDFVEISDFELECYFLTSGFIGIPSSPLESSPYTPRNESEEDSEEEEEHESEPENNPLQPVLYHPPNMV
jgi:hypothetical protein